MRGPRKADYAKLGDEARRVQLHPATLRRWVKDGRLTGYGTPGGALLLDPDEVDLVLAQRHHD